MATHIADFWGDLGAEQVHTPLIIMREQAALLGEKTKNLLEASVETRAHDSTFYHSFYITVPALDNYTYRLFRVSHGINLYPLQIDSGPRAGTKLESEAEFVEWLRATLSSDETKRIIANLVAQVRG